MTTDNVAMLVSLFVPILVSMLKRQHYPTTLNAIIAAAVYVVVGVVYVVASGQAIDVNNLVPTIGIFTGGGTIAYQLFWKNWGDPQIQTAVSGKPS